MTFSASLLRTCICSFYLLFSFLSLSISAIDVSSSLFSWSTLDMHLLLDSFSFFSRSFSFLSTSCTWSLDRENSSLSVNFPFYVSLHALKILTNSFSLSSFHTSSSSLFHSLTRGSTWLSNILSWPVSFFTLIEILEVLPKMFSGWVLNNFHFYDVWESTKNYIYGFHIVCSILFGRRISKYEKVPYIILLSFQISFHSIFTK